MRSRKQISSDCSRAGSFGASVRWANHQIIPTTLIRVYKNDADFISSLRAVHGSAASSVHYFIELYNSSNCSVVQKSRKFNKKC